MIRPRSKLRRGEPTKQEKQDARVACCERAGEVCEGCGRYLPVWVEQLDHEHSNRMFGQLHHEHSKRRFGWMESETQRHLWLCARCHHETHNPKACPTKPILEG